MSMLTRLRRFWLDVHLWLGVGLFIPIVIIGLTGSALVWHDALDRQLHPQRFETSAGPALPLAAHVAAMRDFFGDDFVVASVRPPEHAGGPVMVQARAKARPPEGQRPLTRTAWIDPASGRVLGAANPRVELIGIMHALHGTLMIPEVGRKIVGWIGWAMLISSLTGIWLWWPRNGALLAGLRWRRSPRTTTNLHHLTGFWIAIPLAVLSLTGVYISFPQMSRGVLAHFVDVPAQAPGGGGGRGGPAPLSETHLDADAAARAALAAAPGADLIAINLPIPGRDGAAPAWRVQVRSPGVEANATIEVNDETGALEVRGDAAPSADQNVARFMRRLHDGSDMGAIWQTIIFIGGIAPALLGVTGIIMWLRRRAARRAIQRGHPRGDRASAGQAAE